MKKILALSFLFSVLMAAASYAATAADNWESNCTRCHGTDGSGNTKMGKKYNLKDYTDDAVKAAMKDDEMFKAIKEGVTVDGKERMKGYKDDLSDAEITDLVTYIRKMKK
jgi:cytochrome c553